MNLGGYTDTQTHTYMHSVHVHLTALTSSDKVTTIALELQEKKISATPK